MRLHNEELRTNPCPVKLYGTGPTVLFKYFITHFNHEKIINVKLFIVKHFSP